MKLLVVKMSSLGDIIHAKEALSCVPDVTVDWVVEKPFEDLVKGSVNKVLTVDTKKWRKKPFYYRKEIMAFIRDLRSEDYDVIVDVQGNIKSSLVLAFAVGRKKIGFGVKTVPEKINLFFTSSQADPPFGKNIRQDYLFLLEKALHFVSDFKVYPKGTKYQKVLVCPFSAWKNKEIPQEHFVRFLTLFQECYHSEFYFLWGSPSEEIQAKELQAAFPGSILIPRLSLPELEKHVKTMDFVIAMDSFPLHLAGSLGKPSLAFFGPTSAPKYNPMGEQALFYQGACPYGEKFEKRCPKLRTCPTGACLREKTGDELWESVRALL